MRLRSTRSLSLIEVLISIGIVSSAVVLLFQSFTAALTAARFSQNISLACFLAEEKLFEAEWAFRASPYLSLSQTGNAVIQATPFTWETSLSLQPHENVASMVCGISWPERGRQGNYTLSLYGTCMKKEQ